MSDLLSPPAAPVVATLRAEYIAEALGIGVAAPRLSWITETAAPGWMQLAYAIEYAAADGTPFGQTGRVEGGESSLVAWPFAPLASRQRVTVRAMVWGEDQVASPWSPPLTIETGMLRPADWTASFIAPGWDEDLSSPQPCPLLRRSFDIRPDVASARLHITAHGVYAAQINGAAVGDHALAPGWTSYGHRLRYQTFDVTALLRDGENAIGAMLGDGWYRGRLGFGGGRRNLYGDRLALLAELIVTYADGSEQRVVSDGAWRASTGPILASDIYDGETYDARLERDGWSEPGFDDGAWAGVRVVEADMARLEAPVGPPARQIETLAPAAMLTSPSGKTIVDFGQNLVGWVRLTVSGEQGQTITLRHAEVLEGGEICTRPLRHAAATDSYTLCGGAPEIWEPRFTFHGFRYVEVGGWPGELYAENLLAVVCHSDMERSGWFTCSDPLVDRLHQNVVWGMRGNFLDVPTDCPQRDERLGWTGDIQVFAPTASFLYDTAGFLRSWLADLAAEQRDHGGLVPMIVPNVMADVFPAAAWGDAATVVPWVLYQHYGDLVLLAAQFDSMRAWVDSIAAIAGPSRLWDQGFQFGDWLDPTAPPDRPADAKTSPQIVATAYFARSADLVRRAAEVLGREEDVARYGALAAEVRAAFAAEYITPSGRLLSDAVTAYALALQFGLLPDAAQRQRAGDRLVELLRAGGYHIATGFVGTPLVCDALSDAGHTRQAYRLLLQRESPSWLYPVTMGATTIWERWDSILPDGSVNPGEMTSFNHYALGAVADWLHRVVGGLAPASPGYRTIAIAPRPGGGISSASARHATPYGIATCSWAIVDGVITIEATIPPNTTAQVTLPGGEGQALGVGAGTHGWSYAYTDADAAPPITLDSSIDDLIDDGDAWDRTLGALREALPHNPFVAMMLQSQGRSTLRRVVSGLPGGAALLPQVAAALAIEPS